MRVLSDVIEPFGLMVALDKDIHGLAHISELADEAAGNLQDKFKIGQVTDFEIVSLEPPEHRLGLRLYGVKGKVKKESEPAKATPDKEEVKKSKKTAKKEKVAEADKKE